MAEKSCAKAVQEGQLAAWAWAAIGNCTSPFSSITCSKSLHCMDLHSAGVTVASSDSKTLQIVAWTALQSSTQNRLADSVAQSSLNRCSVPEPLLPGVPAGLDPG